MLKKSARRSRCTHTPTLKARVALPALREDKTTAQLYVMAYDSMGAARSNIAQYFDSGRGCLE